MDSFLAVIGPECEQVTGDTVCAEPGYAVTVRGSRAAIARDADHVVAFVGRLDNGSELAAALGVRQTLIDETAAATAARLLLAAHRRWGCAFLDRALGSFSGVVLDLRRREFQVFRDLTAGCAAYVTTVADHLVCGSSLADVAAWRGDLRPSELFVASYFQNLWLDARATPYDGVDAVIPGHVATGRVGAANWRQARHADWHVRRIRHRHFDDYLAEFTMHLDEAVRCRLEGVSKVGLCLSGGLDSTNVLASLIRVVPSGVSVQAYAIPFQTPRGDERARQRAVAAHCGVPLTWVPVDQRGPFGRWSGQLFAGRQAPPLGGNWYFGESLCERAAADGVGVLYDGEDADSLLSGNRTYLADLLITGHLASWLREARRIRAREDQSIGRLLRYSLYKQIPNTMLAAFGRRPMAAAPSPLIATAFAERVGLERRLKRMPVARVWHPGRRFRRYITLAGGAHHLGMVVPELAMAARDSAVVLAHPFFDRRLMTFCMGLPWDVICGDFTPKRLLRELARRHLPEQIFGSQTKAQLDEYYDAAVFGHENELVMKGLDLALKKAEWTNQQEIEKLINCVEEKTASFMPSRVAMLMLWDQHLPRSADHVGLVRA